MVTGKQSDSPIAGTIGEGDRHSGQHVHLTFPPKAEYLALSRLAISALGTMAQLDEETVADLKVAVTEACSIFVRHVDCDAPVLHRSPVIAVAFSLFDDRWVIVVSDEGAGLLPEKVELEDPAGEDGLGITVIRALVDEFGLEAFGSKGTTAFKLAKRI